MNVTPAYSRSRRRARRADSTPRSPDTPRVETRDRGKRAWSPQHNDYTQCDATQQQPREMAHTAACGLGTAPGRSCRRTSRGKAVPPPRSLARSTTVGPLVHYHPVLHANAPLRPPGPRRHSLQVGGCGVAS
ncbi:hypothetical protein GWK47_006259 [Chionoecetes opilio]|uniref:Uncharacterized protein n=1 Tax=Chionoecetes opilio TaxID=41210 RepID=A0A8J4Y7P2_CHIOP|nr:hypothetical protein GWK47_006259 [Chionoecetes opilio]